MELYRLIEKVSNYDITLVAGKTGIHNTVTWTQMVENEEASSFLEGGEIAFITGIGLTAENNLFKLIKCIYKKKAAGVVINLGPFIEKIQDEILLFCETNNFPLFTVPWKIHLAEIMKIFSFSINYEEQYNHQIAAAFKNAIIFPKQEELYTVALTQNNFMPNWNYQVCAVKISDSNGIALSPKQLDKISLNLNNHLSHHKHLNFTVFTNDNEILIVMANHSEAECNAVTEDIRNFFMATLVSGEQYLIGVGRSTKSIRCLYKSYNQALSIQRLHNAKRINPLLINYSELGIYRLLIGIEDNDIITDYYQKTIKPLADYDAANGSDICDILRSYLMHNGSVKDTADEFFVHRNTINYKLGKASEILNVDLSTLETRVQLYLGFMLKDML